MDYIEQLILEFPKSLTNVTGGIYFGKGWLEPIRKALQVIESCKGVEVGQIKEKFGGLRIYIDCSEDLPEEHISLIKEAINKAEEECWKICERCGQGGDLKNRAKWLVTLCNPCFDKANEIAL